MTMFDVTDRELDTLRRQAMAAAAQDMRHAAEALADLAIMSSFPRVQASDTQTSVSCARESLALVDRLGWPEISRDHEDESDDRDVSHDVDGPQR